MDLHLDDAVAQGNSMLDQMKGEGMSSKSLQSNKLNHYEDMLGQGKKIVSSADSTEQTGDMVGNVGQMGLGMAKEGGRIAKVGLKAYGIEQAVGAAKGLSSITGVSAVKGIVGAVKTASFTPSATSEPMAYKGFSNVNTSVSAEGVGDQATRFAGDTDMMTRGSGMTGAISTDDDYFSRGGAATTKMEQATEATTALKSGSQSADAVAAAAQANNLQGVGSLSKVGSTADAGGVAGSTQLASATIDSAKGGAVVSDASKGAGSLLGRIGGAASGIAESGVGRAAMGGARVLGVVGGGVNLAEDLQGGHFHIAGDDAGEKIGNVSGMVASALDVASLAVPVLAPLAAVAGITSAISTGLGELFEGHQKVDAANKGIGAASKSAGPISSANLQSEGLVANRGASTQRQGASQSSF